MTRAELIAEISTRLGLDLRKINERELQAFSPSNVSLFVVRIFEDDAGDWHFGGCGGLLQDQWADFCRIGDRNVRDRG